MSFFLIITSIAISGGFRSEISAILADTYSDISMDCTSMLPALDSIPGIEAVRPAIVRGGIVRSGMHITGAQFRGISGSDSIPSLSASIPSSLASSTGLEVGDRLQTYFVGDRLQARVFTVSGIYEDLADKSSAAVIKVPLGDLQRLEGLESDEFTSLDILLDGHLRTRDEMTSKAREITLRTGIFAQSLPDRFPALYDWLDLIDANVMAILLLMALVAGFNMISGLLILLMQNISTIGILKSMGMSSRGIAGVFLRVASAAVLKGMALGNAAAALFCIIQGSTHLVRLNAENYFLSYVPVSADWVSFLAADLAAYVLIMIMLLLPTLFISRVDPARTARAD